jgi:hypothetical protein
MAKSRKNAVKKTKIRRRRHSSKNYKLRGAGWFDSLMGTNTNNGMNNAGMMNPGMNNAGMMNPGMNTGTSLFGSKPGMFNSAQNLYNTHVTNPNSSFNQGLNKYSQQANGLMNQYGSQARGVMNQYGPQARGTMNQYGSQAKGYMSNLFGSNNQQPQQSYNQGTSSSWLGAGKGTKRRRR